MAQRHLVGQGLLVIEASRSHSDTPQSVGTVPASERPQTHAVDRTATEIGTGRIHTNKITTIMVYRS